MAAIVPASAEAYYDSVSVDATADLLFDTRAAGAGYGGLVTTWEVHVANDEATSTDLLYVGFDSSVTVNNGYPVVGAGGERVFMVPPGTTLYGIGAAARDARIIAIPRFL